MTSVRRLILAGAFIALAAVLINAHLWGEPSKKAPDPWRFNGRRHALAKAEENFAEDLANSKFARGGLLTYKTTAGDIMFALQIKPKLDPAPARPRDILVMVDTSASQVKGPLSAAINIAEELISHLGAGDHVAVWTVNIPKATRNLTGGFKTADSPQVKDALAKLKQEVPLGDTDLKEGLRRAVETFERNPDHQQVVFFLGDGMSVHNPITDSERARLAEDMVRSGVAFYPVPLGPRNDPKNLHGLATGTGGTILRMEANDKPVDIVKKLQDALAVSVLYPTSFRFGAEVTQAFPTNLPPLRADAPTLVVGRIQAGNKVTYTLEGTCAGRDVHLEAADPLSEPEPDNFFLVGIVEQWKNGKDQPALTRADRALAYAYEQANLARAEILAQAEWALGEKNFEAAKDLFDQAKKLDPQDVEAEAGLRIVQKLKADLLKGKNVKQVQAQEDKNGRRQLAQANPGQDVKPPAAGGGQPQDQRGDLLQEQLARRRIEEQRLSQVVEEARRQARQLLRTDPDAARDLLRQTRSAVQDDPDIGTRTQQLLLSQLESSLRTVETQGRAILLEREEQLRRQADAERRRGQVAAIEGEEERTKRRMQAFGNLMAQARFEDAYLQSLAVIQDAVNSGRRIPQAAVAGYDVGLWVNQLSQLRELKRTREERFLLTLMQVERSHVPFPDEPPIQFPPAAVWRELTRLRKEKYESSGFTEDDPETLRRIRYMRDLLSKPVTFEKGLEAGTKFRDALDYISDRYDVTIVVDTAAFKAQQQDVNLDDKEVKLPRMVGVSLATVLRLLTAQVDGTYLVRRDYIEITTGDAAVTEKVIRVYPVADLVTPIPNSFNARAVGSVLSILGTSPGLGLQLGAPQVLGQIGQGLGLGGLGGGGLVGLGGALGLGGIGGLGGLGGLGGGGAALGFAGGGLGGLGGGFGGAGGGFQGGQVNLGVGGGALGFGGGQLGQLGNLGGQFGLQGGDQSIVLIRLIRDVIGNPKKDWAPLTGFNRGPAPGPQNPAGDRGDDQEVEDVPEKWNSIGYYPPARALVVKGSSRIHTNLGGPLIGRGGPPGMGALERGGKDVVVFQRGVDRKPGDKPNDLIAAKPRPDDKKVQVAANNKLKPDGDAKAPADLDPKKIWEDALARGVKEPGLIIACADFLASVDAGHVVEFLKANLRQGIVARPWVYESLALALEASHGSPEDIERARLSVIDLEPQDAQSYVQASKAMAEHGEYARAVAFCRQAALLEPNLAYPYEEALIYADLAKDADGMRWAAGNLLRQDWPVDNNELHQKAGSKVKDLAAKLETDHRQADAAKLLGSVNRLGQRDLVIELQYQGDAELDMEVKEPIGTVCSYLQRQSPGGGILLGDTLADAVAQKSRDGLSNAKRQMYVATQAFSGIHEITLRRIWGRPLGGKATVEIIQHQGAANEIRRRMTVTFDRTHTFSIALDDGRRTSAEYVPPPTATQRTRKVVDPLTSDKVLNKLRKIADPEFSGKDIQMAGGLGAVGTREVAATAGGPQMNGAIYQTKLASAVSNGSDLTAQAIVGPDQTVQMKLSPVFRTGNRSRSKPAVWIPLIPGGSEAAETP
jgi:tetratricopeptide (TPR) repeat protein